MLTSLIQSIKVRITSPVCGSAESNHAIRVNLKRLRASIRLFKPTIDEKIDFKAVDTLFKQAADLLGPYRDHAVLLASIEWLKKKSRNSMIVNRLSRIDQALRQQAPLQPVKWRHFKSLILSAQRQIKSLNAPLLNEKRVLGGLRDTVNKCKKYGNEAFGGSNDKTKFHQFRRWVKYFIYQLESVAEQGGVLNKTSYKQLKTLGDLLGWAHDLENLNKHIKKQTVDDTDEAAVIRIDKLIIELNKRNVDSCKKYYKSLHWNRMFREISANIR